MSKHTMKFTREELTLIEAALAWVLAIKPQPGKGSAPIQFAEVRSLLHRVARILDKETVQ